jgi:DNA-binding Lrp family transcriptional regulator
MPQHDNVQLASKEARIELALQAIQQNATITQRRAASIYNVSQKTLSRRLAGTSSRRSCTPNSKNLSKTEEEVVV